RPQHMLGGIGLLFFGLGTMGLAYLGLLWTLMNLVPVFEPSPIGGRPLLLYSVASLLLGAQGLSLGMIAELVVANTGRERDSYSVTERTPMGDQRRDNVNV